MSNYEMMKIKKFAEVVSGSTPKTMVDSFWNGELLWITPAEIKQEDKYINTTTRTISELGVKSCSLKKLPKNTVILTSRAPIGKVALAGKEMYCNQGFKNLICNEEIAYPLYIYYWLQSQTLMLNNLGRGATFKEISKKIVNEIEIPIYTIDLQFKIANILDKAQFLIDKRKSQIESLDQLIKSIFYNMFGDLAINNKGWGIKKLEDVTNKITDGKHGDCKNKEGSGYFFISAKDIYDGRIVYDNARQITKSDFDETHKRTKLGIGDIIVVNTGATIGKTALVSNKNKCQNTTFQKSVGIIETKREELSNVFLQQYIIIDRDNIYNSASGSAQKNWLLSQMRNYRIIVPPINLQDQFANIVTKIEEQKTLIKQSILESKNLFNSLIDRYFD